MSYFNDDDDDEDERGSIVGGNSDDDDDDEPLNTAKKTSKKVTLDDETVEDEGDVDENINSDDGNETDVTEMTDTDGEEFGDMDEEGEEEMKQESKKESKKDKNKKEGNKKEGKKTSNKLNYLNNDDEDENEDDDYDNDDYLQKFNEGVSQNYILDNHPECVVHNYNEVLSMCSVTRDTNGIIMDDLHKTIPYLTKYERARILGVRAKQLNCDATPFIKLPEGIIDGYVIAEMELKEKKIPFIIRRPMPNGGSEYWFLKDLEDLSF